MNIYKERGQTQFNDTSMVERRAAVEFVSISLLCTNNSFKHTISVEHVYHLLDTLSGP